MSAFYVRIWIPPILYKRTEFF